MPGITLALLLSYTHEGMQYYAAQNPDIQAKMEDGRFDPVDLAMYAVGAVFAYRVSKWVNGPRHIDQPKNKKRRK